jgi:hypothetical protein
LEETCDRRRRGFAHRITKALNAQLLSY